MTPVWEEPFRLRTNDFDPRLQWKPSAVLDLFQSAAGVHADSLCAGYRDMLSQGLLWVLVRVKYEVIATPPLYSRVIVRTWPLAPGGMSCRRDYLVTDEAGGELLRGTSDWVFLDAATRKLAPPHNVYPPDATYLTERALSGRVARVPDFEGEGPLLTVIPGFSEEDMNGHVNNTRYADFALNALSPAENERIAAFQIDFRREVLPGEPLTLSCRREDGRALVRGEGGEGECRFACAVTWA
ncbi:MAG: hypothetical protein J6X61_00670 [Clostridia bacterium]|nr:hypothetical protein [Clostridia bacterium]